MYQIIYDYQQKQKKVLVPAASFTEAREAFKGTRKRSVEITAVRRINS